MGRAPHPLCVWVLGVAALAAMSGAPVQAAELGPGRVTARVACLSDPRITYAAYVPSSYTPERGWPVLFVMDPRGRAVAALERFQEAAERLGYIVISSYDTRSDVPRDRNIQAIKALLPEAEKRFSINTRRLYLAGFSGTARTAWVLALALKGFVAGIVGFGGGLPGGFEPAAVPVPFFGGAGTTDFNYEEMRALDRTLDAVGTAHRFVVWDGPHSWAPPRECGRALEWMELQAMLSRQRVKDDALIQALFNARVDEARGLEESGRTFEAFVLYRALAGDFVGLHDVAEPRARADELRRTRPVRRTEARLKGFTDEHDAYHARFWRFLEDLAEGEEPRLGRPPSFLRLDALKRRAADTEDVLDSQAAQRLLEMVFTQMSFYKPREFLDSGRPAAALTSAAIAGAIKPEHPRVCLQKARAQAQLGQLEEALGSLRCAVDSGVLGSTFLESDPYLEPVRNAPAFQRMIDKDPGD